MRIHRFLGGVLATAVVVIATGAHGAEPIYVEEGLALSGYDAVSYFTRGAAVKGDPRFEYVWSGARWQFASEADRNAFVASPQKYAPQYGGYCAYAVSRKHTAPGDPEAWRIVNGRLYVNYDKSVRALWEKELPEVIRLGDSHWPGVLTSAPSFPSEARPMLGASQCGWGADATVPRSPVSVSRIPGAGPAPRPGCSGHALRDCAGRRP